MLLTVDIGNTTISVGIFRDKDLVQHWKMASDRKKTDDEYRVILTSLLNLAGLNSRDVDGVIISSVVPTLIPVFQDLSRTLFRQKPFIVGPGIKTGMPILYENPQEVGADRIVASIAAFEKYGGPAIIVDFGTATTFDAISEKGEYLGGAIAPGIQISAEALFIRTAKQPHVEVRKPRKALGRTTETSMQSGLYFGYLGLVSRIISEIAAELGGEVRVIATGGFAASICSDIEAVQHQEPHLIEEGLRILYERNRT